MTITHYTQLNKVNRQVLRDVIPLAKPFTILIEPSSLCNFRCLQCFQSIRSRSYFTENRSLMPMDRFLRVIDQLKSWQGPRHKVLKLSLYGEPMTHPEFTTMVQFAKQADVAERIETTTNASLLSEQISDQLIAAQLDYMRVSIYGASQDRHAEVTQAKISLESILEKLKQLQLAKKAAGSLRPFVSCKMMDSFGSENQEFLRRFSEVADEVYIDKPHGWIQADGVDFLKSYYKEQLPIALADAELNSRERIACPMAFTTMAIRSNGAVSPCCVDYIGGTNIGDVDVNTLQAIWESDDWLKFQKMQLENHRNKNSSCSRCDIYRSSHYTRDDIDGFPVDKLRPLPSS